LLPDHHLASAPTAPHHHTTTHHPPTSSHHVWCVALAVAPRPACTSLTSLPSPLGIVDKASDAVKSVSESIQGAGATASKE
jgi:hypothetical protein